MKKKIITTAVSLTFAIATIASAHPASHLKPRADTCTLGVRTCTGQVVDACCLPDNGIMVLAQQWFPGLGPSDEFTLHGLFPDTCGGGIVGNCDPSREHDDVESRLSSYPHPRVRFMQDMEDYWSSYKKTSNNQPANNDFWSHEWNTHGTCVSTLNPNCFDDFTQDQDLYMFFDRTLALRKEFDIFPALAKANITPGAGAMYNVDDIHAAIRANFNVEASIECPHGLPLE
ncbi:ribonuclease T2-like, partial [Podila verticillata]